MDDLDRKIIELLQVNGKAKLDKRDTDGVLIEISSIRHWRS